MSNLTDPKLIWLKGMLLNVLGIIASVILILRSPNLTTPNLTTVFLLGIAIWAFCRACYFAFYVIEKYFDPSDRFAGLFDFAKYAMFGKPADRR